MKTLNIVADACCAPGTVLIPQEQAHRYAARFKALSDPVRLRLLCHIASSEHGTACACHLPDALGISQPTLSHHLRKLVDAGFVTREQRGKWAHYSLVESAATEVIAFLNAQLRTSEG